MKSPLFIFKRIGVMINLLMVALLAACIPTDLNIRKEGPPSGIVEMDQNTDPRFFIRNQPRTIGFLKKAGNEVRLNGRKVTRDIYIRNGAHVSTGDASAAIIEFFTSDQRDCEIEVHDFRHGRLFGLAKRCGHIVVTEQGVMEISGWASSYHAEVFGEEITVFTVIDGQASVWLHSDHSPVVVPANHQVSLSYDRISPPKKLTISQIEELTQWRKNFPLFKKRSQPQSPPVTVPNLEKKKLYEVRRLLKRLELGLSYTPQNATDQYTVYEQNPRYGKKVKKRTVVNVKLKPQSPVTVPQIKPRPLIILEPQVLAPLVTVPNLERKNLGEARRLLKKLELGLQYTPQNATDQYWIYEQSPDYGKKVKKGTVVNVKVQAPVY